MARRPQTYKSRKDTRIKKKMVVGAGGLERDRNKRKGRKVGETKEERQRGGQRKD